MPTFLDENTAKHNAFEINIPRTERINANEALKHAQTLTEEDLKKETEKLKSKLQAAAMKLSEMHKQRMMLMANIQIKGDKMKQIRQCPQHVATVVELLDPKEVSPLPPGCIVGADNIASTTIVVRTADGNMYLAPNMGMVQSVGLNHGDMVGLHKNSKLIVAKLPPTYDRKVMAMQVIQRPKEKYCDIGGLDKQLQEIEEAVVYPITRKELFKQLGVTPCKGVLLHGPPGTGKTMIARAVAAQVNCTFMKLSATALVQLFIGEGARILRETFKVAKSKAPAIIFIDELDAIGTIRNTTDHPGSRDAQRTMIELLNEMDGFDTNEDVKVIAATNRLDMLDPALLRTGRFDRKVEIPLPNELGRITILKLHASKTKVDSNVNFEEIAKCTVDFSGAQCRAVVIEAGMVAMRKGRSVIMHDDFVEATTEVLAFKKKMKTDHYI